MTVHAAYVLPIRWSPDVDTGELTEYLSWLEHQVAQVVVVDGSDHEHFTEHARRWSRTVRHVSPHADLEFLNGKVDGVVTGLREASFDRVIIADDDVRYDERSLREVIAGLDKCDAVVPQNYFHPLPWFAWCDTARTLLNRATGGDFPGTIAVRRSVLQRAGGYDGDVLFENLEMLRTIDASGGVVRWFPACFVRRLPGTASRFMSQRVRQAYDEFARPRRLALWLSVAPVTGVLSRRRQWTVLAALAAVASVLAELGRRRDGGRAVFPPGTSLFAPLWVAERAVCSWAAVVVRLMGGVRYGGRRIVRAATPARVLRDRLAPASGTNGTLAVSTVSIGGHASETCAEVVATTLTGDGRSSLQVE